MEKVLGDPSIQPSNKSEVISKEPSNLVPALILALQGNKCCEMSLDSFVALQDLLNFSLPPLLPSEIISADALCSGL